MTDMDKRRTIMATLNACLRECTAEEVDDVTAVVDRVRRAYFVFGLDLEHIGGEQEDI